MSKLYDTLEKIRKNYQKQAFNGAVLKGGQRINLKGANRQGVIIGAIILALGIGLFLFSGDKPKVAQNNQALQEGEYDPAFDPIMPVVASDLSAEPIAEDVSIGGEVSAESIIPLNNKGAELVKNKKHNEAIYFFTKALEENPQQIAPLINLAVTYTELGIYGKAIGFFEKAYEIDPVNQKLLLNLQMLNQANLLGDSSLSQEVFEDLVAPEPDLEKELRELETNPDEDV